MIVTTAMTDNIFMNKNNYSNNKNFKILTITL